MSNLEKAINNAFDRELQQVRARLAWYEAHAARTERFFEGLEWHFEEELQEKIDPTLFLRAIRSIRHAYRNRPK